ncbi:hypothetical protein CYMTET_44220 [Cymbomonas tetramitiformis]|uniref:Uncharacterized protein n=1 Tax=Cymbomonas tetramitiformis TaxID=36881 RepID=A0AAE0C0Q4_9CHLO|nr:hypothetical protein CYMTET_44220 [Cymbomonas tetramitiformis]
MKQREGEKVEVEFGGEVVVVETEGGEAGGGGLGVAELGGRREAGEVRLEVAVDSVAVGLSGGLGGVVDLESGTFQRKVVGMGMEEVGMEEVRHRHGEEGDGGGGAAAVVTRRGGGDGGEEVEAGVEVVMDCNVL